MPDTCEMFNNCKKGVESRNVYHREHGQQEEYVDTCERKFPCKGGKKQGKSKKGAKSRKLRKSGKKSRKSKK
jgi:hypothetical protein